MKSLGDEIFVCVDCESTGLDPNTDRILEIAAARFSLSALLEHDESLINPEREIPQASQVIHKISNAMVENQPKIIEVLPRFLKLCEGKIIVGHGVGFDLA